MKTLHQLHQEEQREAARCDMARQGVWVGLHEEVRLNALHKATHDILWWSLLSFAIGLVVGAGLVGMIVLS